MNVTQDTANRFLAAFFAMQATGLALTIFMYSKGDHDMKLLALGAVISQVSALMATASTMLVGRSFESKTNPADLPPGSVAQSIDTVQTPPISPTQPTEATQ